MVMDLALAGETAVVVLVVIARDEWEGECGRRDEWEGEWPEGVYRQTYTW